MIVFSSETISKINIIVFSSQIVASFYNFHIHLHLDYLAIYIYTSLTNRSRMSQLLADYCTKPTRRSQTDREHRNSLQFQTTYCWVLWYRNTW